MNGIDTQYILSEDFSFRNTLSSLFLAELYSPELDPPVRKEASMRLIDANNDTCLILDDTEMFAFSPLMGQWLPHPHNACWRSGLVIKHRVTTYIKTSFKMRITGHRLVCDMSHLKVMTSNFDVSGCGLVSGNYQMCKLSGVTKPEPGSLTTCIAACKYTEKKRSTSSLKFRTRSRAGHCATSASIDELEARIGFYVMYSQDVIIGTRIPFYGWKMITFHMFSNYELSI